MKALGQTRLGAPLIGLTASLVLATCGGEDVDTTKVEDQIAKEFDVYNAACPDGVEAKKGETFTCVGNAPGAGIANPAGGGPAIKQVDYKVVMLDDEGTDFRITPQK